MRTYNSLVQMTLFHFRSLMRNKIAFFFNLIMPLIFLAIFGSMFGGSGSKSQIKIGLVDRDGGPTAVLVRNALESSGFYTITEGDEADLLQKLGKGQLRSVVVLPESLSQAVANHGAGQVVVRLDASSAASGGAVGGLERLLSGLDAAGRGTTPALAVRLEAMEGQGSNAVMDFMMPGMLTYMLMNAGIVSVAITIAYHRENGTMRHMFSTPLRISHWLAGRVVANTVLAFVQIAVLYGVGMALYKVKAPTNLLGTVVVLLLCTWAGLAIGLVIGAFAKNGDAAQAISLIAAMMLSFLGNAMFPLDQGPELLQNISKAMPTTYMTQSLQQVMMKGQALGTVPVEIAVLVGCSALFFTIAATRLRKQFTTA